MIESLEGAVTVKVSPAILARLTAEWSEPIQVKIVPIPDTLHWEMICRTPAPPPA